MVEKESEWVLPENLRKQEVREIQEVEQGIFNGKGDFGSYYAYLTGSNKNFINSHAVSDDQIAYRYVTHINAILEKHSLELKGDIIDIGCAIGTITNGIYKLNKRGNTCGLDISSSSIEVAKNKYPNCFFYNQSADELENFDDEQFDVIHSREFYPFTRTNDHVYQLTYLNLFYQKLKPHGIVVLQTFGEDIGFCNTYKKLSYEIDQIGYSSIQRITMLPNFFFRLFGKAAYGVIFHPVLLAITKTAIFVTGRGRRAFLYILRKG